MDLSPFAGALFLLSLLGYAFGLMMLFPRLPMGGALLSALCGMLWAAYVGVILLGWMVPMAYGLLLLGLLFFQIGIVFVAMDCRNMRRRVLSVSFFAYLAMSALFVVLFHGKVMGEQDHDSYSFWARAVRELFTFDASYMNGDSNISHGDYPPLFAALQYCLVRVFGWQDASLSCVVVACVVTSVCAMSDLIRSKPFSVLFAGLSLCLYPLFTFRYGLLVVDGPMSMLFLAALISLIYREDGRLPSLLPALFAAAVLPSVKIYAGLLLAVVLAAILWLQGRKDAARRVRPGYALLACLLILFMQFSWSGYYHFGLRQAGHERQMAQYSYLGEEPPSAMQAPGLQWRDLIAGNPRTEQLTQSVTPESLRQVGDTIIATGKLVQSSRLTLALLFLAFLTALSLMAEGIERRRLRVLLFTLPATAACYTLGLFGGYFVQPEIAGGAIHYLSTVALPFPVAALFGCLRPIAGSVKKQWIPRALVLSACAVCIAFFANPVGWLAPAAPAPAEWETPTFGAHARVFFDEEAAGLLTPEDANLQAVLMDCTWAASQIRSKSGVTHAYQYHALPIRLSVYQFEYGNYGNLESITEGFLKEAVLSHRANLLILRTDDPLYESAFADALDLETDADMPWVLDVAIEDGQPVYTLRNQEEWD